MAACRSTVLQYDDDNTQNTYVQKNSSSTKHQARSFYYPIYSYILYDDKQFYKIKFFFLLLYNFICLYVVYLLLFPGLARAKQYQN